MSPVPMSWTPRRLLAALAALLATVALVAPPGPARAADPLISQGRPTTASSTENAGTPASNATDGDTGTRWSSAFADPQWLQVDLGATATVTQVVLNWEAAYAHVVPDPDLDRRLHLDRPSTPPPPAPAAPRPSTVSGTGRYVRMYGTARGHRLRLLALGVPGLRQHRRHRRRGCGTATNAAQGKTGHRLLHRERRHPRLRGRRRQRGHPLVERRRRPAVAPGRPGHRRGPSAGCVLTWETAYATGVPDPDLRQTAPPGPPSTPPPRARGGTETLTVNGTGRYVRMYGTARATGYGYSLWEFAVNTTGGGTVPGGGSLGPNVITFDPSMSAASIQAQLDAVFAPRSRTSSAPSGTR